MVTIRSKAHVHLMIDGTYFQMNFVWSCIMTTISGMFSYTEKPTKKNMHRDKRRPSELSFFRC